MTKLTFYGGINEIGGNKTLLEDNQTKILLDFGMSFGKREEFFEEYLTPRTSNALGDFLEMGLVPDIEGIYRTDLVKLLGREPKPAIVDAIFLSHAHADHVNYVSFLHENIPLYCGHTALLILKALNESKTRSIESEILDFMRRPRMRSRREPPVQRKVKTFRTGDKIKIGSLTVEPVHVDHSIPGAYGFIIHTKKGAVVYTGDMRLHGRRFQMTEDFIKKAAKLKPIALISEGTRFCEKHRKEEKGGEEEVREECLKEVEKTKGLVIADFNFKDVDRLKTFYAIAQKTKRKLVVHLLDTFLLKYLSQDPKLGLPRLDDPHILIFLPKRQSGTYREDDYQRAERQFYNYPNTVTAEDLEQKKVLLCFSYWKLKELIDIQPVRGSLFIHSLSEPFNEEMEMTYQRLKNWISHYRLKFFQSHCSGHASANELKEIIGRINPVKLFLIHAQPPQKKFLVPLEEKDARSFLKMVANEFGELAGEVIIPQYAKSYEL
jgi:ribonuclease J